MPAPTLRPPECVPSARYFRVSEPLVSGPATILDYRFKAQAEKGVLIEFAPDNSFVDAMSQRRLGALRQWLGRRLGREAVSDEDTRLIVEPIRSAWKELTESDPQAAGRWAAMISELRFRRDGESRLRLYVISHDETDAADADVLELVDWVI